MNMKIDSGIVAKLLKKVYLGGLVEEAVVDFDNIEVQAVDPTSVVFLKVTEPLPEKTKNAEIGRVGIGSPTLSLIIKHLEAIKGEVAISKQDNRLVIAAKDRGEVRYLTVEEEFISTVVAEDNINELMEPCVVSVEIPAQACADFNSYMTLLKTKSAKFCYDSKAGTVHIEAGLESENQFNVPFGKADFDESAEPTGDFSVTVYGSFINQIFGALIWPEKGLPPAILMAPDHPLIVVQDDNNIWACLPLIESAGE